MLAGCNSERQKEPPRPQAPTAPRPAEETASAASNTKTALAGAGSANATPPELFVAADVPALKRVHYDNGQSAGMSTILESLGGGIGINYWKRSPVGV